MAVFRTSSLTSRHLVILVLSLSILAMACGVDSSRPAQSASPSPAAAPLSQADKLVGILEAEKAPYKACLDKVMAQYPVASVAPFSPPPNRAEAQRIFEREKLAMERSMKGAALEKKCGEEFKASIMPKLMAAGASPEAAEDAYSDWLRYFMRGTTPPPKK
jgi:hypothetical protein